MSCDGFPPFISAQLHYLLNHFPQMIKVEHAWSGSKFFPTNLVDVIYNAEFPLAALDVIFGSEDEDFHPFFVAGDKEGNLRVEKHSLSDWNNKDPTRLLFLIQELRCMAEYVPHLGELLQRQFSSFCSFDDILEAESLINVRRCFIEALAPLFGRPLEADSVYCRRATFSSASGSFMFLVPFILSTQFPKQQPSLMLQSTQHSNTHGAPVKSSLLTDYPWSPRWEASQMVEWIFDFLADESSKLQKVLQGIPASALE